MFGFVFIFLALFNNNNTCSHDICIDNLNSNSTFTGYDTVNINWNQQLFNDKVWIELLIIRHQPILENCYYGYTNVIGAYDQNIFKEHIDNTGVYTWHVVNVNYLDVYTIYKYHL